MCRTMDSRLLAYEEIGRFALSACDDFGRVKVEFFWDRAGFTGERPEVRSCWIRVASSLAGKQWGFMAVPRIGQEVVVEFLEALSSKVQHED